MQGQTKPFDMNQAIRDFFGNSAEASGADLKRQRYQEALATELMLLLISSHVITVDEAKGVISRAKARVDKKP